ncbi:MAG: hypothetical protein J6L24_06910 [Oscillospiraceae bacterium]|nr:hypothetical protein [Oscillospiraceae bacterium]
MFFRKKIDRAMKWSRERRMKADGGNSEAPEEQNREEMLPSMEELRAQELEELNNEPVSGKEIATMILSAFLTIFPVCVAVLLLLCAAVYFLFIR